MRVRLRYTATTVGLVLIGVAYVVGQAWTDRPVLPRPRPRVVADRPARPPAPATARELLDRAVALGLTAEQIARLDALERDWRGEAAELEEAVDRARDRFAGFTRESGAKGASIDELQRQSAEFRELSARLRERRGRHAEAARAILTETQRGSLALGPSTSSAGGTR